MNKKKTYNSEAIYLSDRLQSEMKKILQYPGTLIEAPMGYGKTTAVREYLKMTDSKVLWQKIFDDSLSGFWSTFCRQLRELDNARAEYLKQLGFPDDSTTLEKAVELIQDMLPSSEIFWVLDDYHLIDCPELSNFIQYLLWNELTNFHIVLTARFTKSLNREELQLKGYMFYIQKEVLEFTQEDIIEYYRLCGLTAKATEALRLFEYTEGWVSALYLLMLSYKTEGVFITPPSITSLIEKAVYISFSYEMKKFLLSICFFDAFTLEQATYMCREDNSKDILSDLTKRNAFISYDEKNRLYQLHKIFSGFLMSIFEKKKQEEKNEMYLRAAEWYAREGDYITAMNYDYRAHDFEHLLLMLEVDKGYSLLNEHRQRLITYFDECPKEVRSRHPVALLVYALCMFSYNEMERFAAVCEELPILLQDNENIDKHTSQELFGEFELLLSVTEYNDIAKMYEHVQKACDILKHPAQFMDTRGSWTFGSPSVLYMFHRESGGLEKELEVLKAAMPCYDQLAKGHGKGADLVMEAEMYYNRGDLENAEIVAHKAIYLANECKQEDILICAIFLQARMGVSKGDYAYALDSFQRLYQELEQENWYNLLHTLELCEAFLRINLGQKKDIPKWILDGEFQSSRMYFPARAFFNIVYGRLLLIREEYHYLLGSMDQFTTMASVFPNLLGLIYNHIYAAAANEKLFHRGMALVELKQALYLAVPDKIFMPFVENYDWIKPLLEVLYADFNCREAVSSILKINLPYQQALQRIKAEYFTQINPQLTEREMEIARLVAKGLPNNEIGRKLYISPNTVKTLLKRIYEKLGIRSRVMLGQYIEELE